MHVAEAGNNKKPALDAAAQQARQRMQKMFAAAAGTSITDDTYDRAAVAIQKATFEDQRDMAGWWR